jgi:RNA polymerase sigma factor (sigma-70 family)
MSEAASMEMPVGMMAAESVSLDEEEHLVESAKYDREKFAVLYRRHYDAVAGYLYRRTGDPHATEDLVADVFMTVLRKLPGYRHRGRPFRSWLYRIATNAANHWARRQKRDRRRTGEAAPHDAISPEDTRRRLSVDGELEQAQRALLSLPPRQQAVIALHYLEGLSVEDVAQAVGCRVGTVKSRLSRARAALREMLLTGEVVP